MTSNLRLFAIQTFEGNKLLLNEQAIFPFSIKAAGDKLLMNKFMRQNFGGGLTLKNVIS